MRLWQILLISVSLTACAHAPATKPVNKAAFNITVSLDSTDMPEEEVCANESNCVVEAELLDEVNERSINAVMRKLRAAEAAHARHFVLEIDTPGGSVPDGFILAKALERTKLPVTCIVDGTAASMGFYLLQSCQTRVMTTRSQLMAHEPSLSGMVSGRPNEWRSIAAMMESLRQAMAEHCARRLNITVAEYRRHTDGGLMWWLTQSEAMQVSAVDKVFGTYKEALAALSL